MKNPVADIFELAQLGQVGARVLETFEHGDGVREFPDRLPNDLRLLAGLQADLVTP